MYVLLFQEKSLVEISMFQDHKKPSKSNAPTTPEQKKRARKSGNSKQFEKKLAKKLRREQEVSFVFII